MKKLFLFAILGIMFIGANAQVKDLTGGGQSLTGATHTYYFYDAVSQMGTPFSLQLFNTLGGGTKDTSVVTIQQSNSALGSWDDITTATTVNPADSNKFVTDTLYGRLIRIKVVTSATSHFGKFYAFINYGSIK